MRQWAEAAIGRRHVARALRTLAVEGFEIRDVLVDGDSAQHGDRLLVGPHGIFVVGFRTPPGNIWRHTRVESGADTMAAHAQATHRLAEVVSASLLPQLTRLHLHVRPILTVIGPEQEPGALAGGVPLVGPAGLVEMVTTGTASLTPLQISELADRIDDWLALRSVSRLHSRAGRSGGPRGRRGSL